MITSNFGFIYGDNTIALCIRVAIKNVQTSLQMIGRH